MPILTCHCGQKLNIPETLRGKKAKCPRCGKVMPISAAGTVAEAPAAAKAAPPAHPPAPQSHAPAAAPPPKPAKPAQRPKAVDQGEYELDLPELEAPAPARAAARPAARAPSPGLVELDPATPAKRPAAAPVGGLNGIYAAAIRDNQRRERNQTGGEWFNVLGIGFTTGRAIALAVLLLVGGTLVYLYKTGPGRGFRVVSVEPVHTITALDDGGRLASWSPPPGEISPVRQATIGITQRKIVMATANEHVMEPDVWALGFKEQLIVARPHAEGDTLLVRLEFNQARLLELKFDNRYDLMIKPGSFTLEDSSGQTIAPTALIFGDVSAGSTINMVEAEAIDYHSLLPPFAKPTREDLQPGSGGAASGTIMYDGSDGLEGKFEFTSIRFQTGSEIADGLTANGELKLRETKGITLHYSYDGDLLTMNWNKGSVGLWAVEKFYRPQELSPYTKYAVVLLFPRPAAKGKLTLKANGVQLAKFRNDFSGTPPTGATAPAPATSPTPPVAQGGSGKPAGGSVSQQSPDYFTLLLRARENARGVISMSNLQQLGLAILLYVEQHDGRMPDTLQEVTAKDPGMDAITFNPRTKENPGYIYVKPAERFRDIKDPAHTPMLYEAQGGEIDPAGSVFYADGQTKRPPQ